MKILFLSHYYAPEGNAPATRVGALCKHWAAAGHEVTVITCVPNAPAGVVFDGYANNWRSEQQIDGVRVIRVWTLVAANKGFFRRIANYLSYFFTALWHSLWVGEMDLVVATSPQFFCGWAGVWVKRLRRIPMILEIRDLWPESIAVVATPPAAIKPLWPSMLRYLEWLERRMYRAATHIVTVGEGYRDAILTRGVPPEKVSTVSNGVDPQLFTPLAPCQALRSELGATAKHFVVGYIGTVGLAHGLEVVLEAARVARERGFDKLRFAVIGDGACLEALRSDLATDDPGNVVLVGRRPKNEMPRWLASVDACFVHLRDTPLFRSVIPSKIFESLAMQRPVILGVRGCAATLLRELGGGECIGPQDAEQLLSAALGLASDPNRAEQLGETGRANVLRRFAIPQLAGDYLHVISATCGHTVPSHLVAQPRTRQDIAPSLSSPLLSDNVETPALASRRDAA